MHRRSTFVNLGSYYFIYLAEKRRAYMHMNQ